MMVPICMKGDSQELLPVFEELVVCAFHIEAEY